MNKKSNQIETGTTQYFDFGSLGEVITEKICVEVSVSSKDLQHLRALAGFKNLDVQETIEYLLKQSLEDLKVEIGPIFQSYK